MMCHEIPEIANHRYVTLSEPPLPVDGFDECVPIGFFIFLSRTCLQEVSAYHL